MIPNSADQNAKTNNVSWRHHMFCKHAAATLHFTVAAAICLMRVLEYTQLMTAIVNAFVAVATQHQEFLFRKFFNSYSVIIPLAATTANYVGG